MRGFAPESEKDFKDRPKEFGGGQALWLYRTQKKAAEIFAMYHEAEEAVKIYSINVSRVADKLADGFIERMDFFANDEEQGPDLQIIRPREVAAKFYGVEDPAKLIAVKANVGEAKVIECPTFMSYRVRLRFEEGRTFKKQQDAERFAKKIRRLLTASGFPKEEVDRSLIIDAVYD